MRKETTRVCIVCGTGLTDDNWPQFAAANWVNKCAGCLRNEKRAWASKKRSRNSGPGREANLRYQRNRAKRDPVGYRANAIYEDAKKRARRSGMEFTITREHVKELVESSKVCPYFGWRLTFAPGAKAKTLASLDRIDSRYGYVPGNVRVISYLANLMKSNATTDELVAFAKGALAMHTVEKVQGKAGPGNVGQ